MGKIPSTPADSDRTISVEFVRNQAEDDGLEAESAMVVPVVAEKEETSDSDTSGQIAVHGLEVESASRAKAVVNSKSIQLPLEPWLKEIDSGRGIWSATKRFRSDGKKSDKYFYHNEYERPFLSKPNVLEFLRYGTVKGKVVNKKRSAGTTSTDHDYRQTTKRQRTGDANSSNTSGSTGSARGPVARTRTTLPHGFL